MTQVASMGGDTAADFDATGTGQTVAPQPYELGDAAGPLSDEDLRLVDAWWRAANYLAVGQIYLMDNPCSANRYARSTSSRGCSATSERFPASTWCTPI